MTQRYGWLLLFALLGLPAAPSARAQQKPAPEPVAPVHSPSPSDAAEADRLLKENVDLRARIRELESRADNLIDLETRAQRAEEELARLQASQQREREEAETHRRAVADALREFFQTADLVDQTLQRAQLQSQLLRRDGVRVNPIPDAGYIVQELRLAAAVRVSLKSYREVDGVAIRDVDMPTPGPSLGGAVVPQNAVYVNAYAIGRLRTLSDSASFPSSLRDLLHSMPLIYEVAPPPAAPGTNANPSGTGNGAPAVPTSPGAVAPASGQTVAPSVLPQVTGSTPSRSTSPGAFSPGGTSPRSNLVPGSTAVPFVTSDLYGRPVRFPEDFAGKLVLLDFWATWSQPWLQELPALQAAYAKYQGRGLEVLGVNLNAPGQADVVRQFAGQQAMTWTQLYDGKGWNSDVARMYDVRAIPNPYLVDGSSGRILATGTVLRGRFLDSTLAPYFAGQR